MQRQVDEAAAALPPESDPGTVAKLEEVMAQLADAQQRASAAEQRAASVESVRDELEVRVAQLGTKASDLEQRATELETSLNEANAGGDAVRAEIATLTAALAAATARVDELQAAPAPAAESNDEDKAEIARLRGELANHMERAQAAEERAAKLEADVLAAEHGVRALPADDAGAASDETTTGPEREPVALVHADELEVATPEPEPEPQPARAEIPAPAYESNDDDMIEAQTEQAEADSRQETPAALAAEAVFEAPAPAFPRTSEPEPAQEQAAPIVAWRAPTPAESETPASTNGAGVPPAPSDEARYDDIWTAAFAPPQQADEPKAAEPEKSEPEAAEPRAAEPEAAEPRAQEPRESEPHAAAWQEDVPRPSEPGGWPSPPLPRRLPSRLPRSPQRIVPRRRKTRSQPRTTCGRCVRGLPRRPRRSTRPAPAPERNPPGSVDDGGVHRRTSLVVLTIGLALGLMAPSAAANPLDEARGATRAPAYRARIVRLPAATRHLMIGRSWHKGCPVGLGDLRLIKLTYWGFDREAHPGKLVVHRRWAPKVRAFSTSSTTRASRSADAPRRPVRRLRHAIDEGGQHVGLRLPLPQRRVLHVVRTCVRTCDRHQPGRVSLCRAVARVTSQRASLRASHAEAARHARVHDRAWWAFHAIGWHGAGRGIGRTDYQHFSATNR